MRLQVNLLPDVKLEYIRARRMKRLVMGASFAAAGVAFAVFIALFVIVNVVQQNHIANLDKDIEQGVAEIQSVPDIDKVLTIQNQLNSLTALHEENPETSRLFNYLKELTPAQASVSTVTMDFETNKLSLDGEADSLETVNKFADTLKFTTYKEKDSDAEPVPAFSQVVLSNFGVSEDATSFQLTFMFDPVIFDNTKDIELNVPNIISTRSQTEKPSDLFQGTPADEEETQ